MREEWAVILWDRDEGQRSERECGRYGDEEEAVAAANHALAWWLPQNIRVTVRRVFVSCSTANIIKEPKDGSGGLRDGFL